MDENRFLEDFAKNLKYFMQEKNIGQRELAKKTKISQSTINRYLSGNCMPSAKALVNIGCILDCEIDDLISTYVFIHA